ncbi:MAG: AbrB/MazE/SpoVT family DNA-binding domain-containing protein [Acidimicrobiia bacterium]
MSANVTRLAKGGRIVIPAPYRRELGLRPGDEVILILEEGSLRLLTMRQAIEEAQEQVLRHLPSDRRLVEELLQERREQAAVE